MGAEKDGGEGRIANGGRGKGGGEGGEEGVRETGKRSCSVGGQQSPLRPVRMVRLERDVDVGASPQEMPIGLETSGCT